MSPSARTQKGRLIAVATPLGDDALLLRRFTGSEQLGRMFAYHLDLASETPDIPFEDLIGQNITIRLELLSGETRYFNGFVSRFVQTGVGERLTAYRAIVVPWLWFLTKVSDCRIFQNKTIPDIIKEVFRDRGFSDFDDSGLSGDYAEWEYCVQYRETDFNFISRLMEQEGIYYYFKHENGKHTLMLADSPSAHAALPGYENLPFRPPSKARFEIETVSGWVLEKQVQPGIVALGDFDFINPKTPMEAKAAISRQHAVPDFEVFDYPGEYETAADGENAARIRIQELQAQYEAITAATDARGLTPGYRLKVVDHPREDQNREYLITGAEYTIESDDFESGGGNGKAGGGGGGGGGEKRDYECSFTAIEAEQPFRPARITPKPLIQGPQTAIVVGKSGEEIWTDEHGRVKVQFHWDRYGEANEDSSCWIRVASAWAGKNWGQIFLPRIGQEVIVEFLEGDPDRPIITGRVYNGDSKPPYELPSHATMSTMKSLSSKGGGGFNEIRFQDKKDEEQLFIHAEKQLDIRVKEDAHQNVGGRKHLVVDKSLREHIKGNHNKIVGGNNLIQIKGKRNTAITEDDAAKIDGNHALEVGGDATMQAGGNHLTAVTGDVEIAADGAIVIEAGSQLTLVCGGSSVVITSSGVTISGSTITVDGSTVKIASGPGDSPGGSTGPDAVEIAAAVAAVDAAVADPGEQAEIERKRRSGGKSKPKPTPVKPGGGGNKDQPPPPRKVPVEFQLVDAAEQPVANEDYKVLVSGEDQPRTGKTKSDGSLCIEELDPSATCSIQFPNRYDGEWAQLRVEDLA